MSVEITVNRDKRYLLLVGPTQVDVADIKELRGRLDAMLREEGIQHILNDLRALDQEQVRLLDADTLAASFRADLPACLKLAILCRQSQLVQHYINVNECCQGVDLRVFEDVESAESWLCAGASPSRTSSNRGNTFTPGSGPHY